MSELIAQTLANPAVGAAGTAVLMAVVALWLAAAWWAYADASRRTESTLAGYVAAGWIILSTPMLLPLSLAAYTFARPQVARRRAAHEAARRGARGDDAAPGMCRLRDARRRGVAPVPQLCDLARVPLRALRRLVGDGSRDLPVVRRRHAGAAVRRELLVRRIGVPAQPPAPHPMAGGKPARGPVAATGRSPPRARSRRAPAPRYGPDP